MKTAKQYVEDQIVSIGEKNSISIECGNFTLPTIRKAIGRCDMKSRTDSCGNVYAIRKYTK